MEVQERFNLYTQLSQIAQTQHTTIKALLRLHAHGVRYHLGTDQHDWVLPYVIQQDITRFLNKALAELAYLYVARNRDMLGEDIYESMLLNADPSHAPLGPLAYQAPDNVQNPVMQKAMRRSRFLLPGLDAGILTSWWGVAGKGRQLLRALVDMHLQALGEMVLQRPEYTGLILQRVLHLEHTIAHTITEKYNWPTTISREVTAALLVGLHLSYHLVRSRVLEQSDSIPAGWNYPILWQTWLSPRLVFGNKSKLYRHCRYQLALDDSEMQDILEMSEVLNLEGLPKAQMLLEQELKHNAKRFRTILCQVCFYQLEEALIELLADESISAQHPLYQHCHRFLRQQIPVWDFYQDKTARRELVSGLNSHSDLGKNALAQQRRIIQHLQDANNRKPYRALLDKNQAHQTMIAHLLVLLTEQLLAEVCEQDSARLSKRTGAEIDRPTFELYEAGRLYRFGASVKPFLNRFTQAQQVGHYFIDIKDFTRQTSMLKEDVMADFIRREFYEPILAIASEHYHGLPQLADRGGIYLNNLLGDAVSLSGDIVSLVKTSKKIRAHLDHYAQSLRGQLENESPGTDVTPTLGHKLSAGSFISFGRSAVVLNFENSIWGKRTVSIAEKINESARGTARNTQVLTDLQSRFPSDRELPFRVYVGLAHGVPIPAHRLLHAYQAMASGDSAGALSILQQNISDWVAQSIQAGGQKLQEDLERSAAIYNSGDALSAEAFAAYRKAYAHQREYVQHRISMQQLGESFTQRFAFDSSELILVLGLEPQTHNILEIFRFVGRMVFKGFAQDNPVEIWEMVNLADPISQALCQHPLFS